MRIDQFLTVKFIYNRTIYIDMRLCSNIDVFQLFLLSKRSAYNILSGAA